MQLITDEWMSLLCQQITKNGKHIHVALLWKLWLIITFPSMYNLPLFWDQDTISSCQFPFSSSPTRINIASNQFWAYCWASSPLPSWAKASKGRCPRGILVKCPNHLRRAAVLLQARPRWPNSSTQSLGLSQVPPAEESHFQCVWQICRQILTNHLFKLFFSSSHEMK